MGLDRLTLSNDDSGMSPSHCPKCNSENIYPDGNLWICPECFHEWTAQEAVAPVQDEEVIDNTIRDANGNPLTDGDSVVVIKELKIKGSSAVVKVGTKVKNIRLTDAGDGHDIACKIDGIGAINLKSEYVRKA
jgi:protein PhnA